ISMIQYDIAAHEFGHAIYNHEALKDVIKMNTKSLLEEPRAELASLTTTKLLYDNKKISQQYAAKLLTQFALSELRRYEAFNVPSTRAYTISAVHNYKVYEAHGFITLKDDKLHLDQSKALSVLDHISKKFEEILDLVDKEQGEKLENLLKEMEKPSKLVEWLVEKLKP